MREFRSKHYHYIRRMLRCYPKMRTERFSLHTGHGIRRICGKKNYSKRAQLLLNRLRAKHEPTDPENNIGRYTLDRHNLPQPCRSSLRWADWMEKFYERICFRSTVGPYTVATDFLGVDFAFSRGKSSQPVLFETMAWTNDFQTVQLGDGTVDLDRTFTDDQGRCCTFEEARQMHADMIEHLRQPGDKVEHQYARG